MLDVFLDVGLDAAVCLTDLSGEAAHSLDITAAEKERDRHYHDYDCSESPVHRAEEKEGRKELHSCGDDGRNSACKCVRNSCYVDLKTVEHIACMEGFPTRPTALHNLDEVVVDEGVADADFCLCLEAADDVEEEDLSEGAAGEEDDVRSQGAGGSARSDVHQMFADPHVQK